MFPEIPFGDLMTALKSNSFAQQRLAAPPYTSANYSKVVLCSASWRTQHPKCEPQNTEHHHRHKSPDKAELQTRRA